MKQTKNATAEIKGLIANSYNDACVNITDRFSELEKDIEEYKCENENKWNSYYVHKKEINNRISENYFIIQKDLESNRIYTDAKIKQERELITKFFSGYIDGMNGVLLDYMDKKFSIQNKIIGVLAALNIAMVIYIF